jgi:hypothetical protein
MRSYSRQFRLETTLQAEGPFAVGSDSNLPLIGSLHPEDSGAWCTTLSVENTDPWKGWLVTAEYSSERELNETATSDAAIITWSSEQFQRPVIVDQDGEAIVNSAGDPFDPPHMIDDSRRVVTVTKNLATVPSWILTYQDAVNSADFTVDGVSIAEGKAKMQSVTIGEPQSRNGNTFRTVTFSMHLEKNGWLFKPLDAGFRTKIDGVMANVRNDDDGELPALPVPLDGFGNVLVDPSPSTAIYLEFTVYETKDFSLLPLS